MEHLNRLTGQVTEADRGMTEEVKEVFASLQSVYSTMESYLGGIAELTTGSNEISEAMLGLSELSDRNRESILLLEKVIKGFKTA